MQTDLHERARSLLDRATVEGISAEDQRWLSGHVSQCAECSRYAERSQRTVRALESFAFELDPAAAFRVQQSVRVRANWMASHRRNVSAVIPMAIALTIIGSAAMWELAAWLAGRWHLASPSWQAGFAILWLLPSIVLDLLLIFRGKWIGDTL